MMPIEAIDELVTSATSPDDGDLVRAALAMARVEYRNLDPRPTLAQLTRLGALATARIERLGPGVGMQRQVAALNELLFEDEGFTGNTAAYDDPRNSFLNDVVARRTGIPISLSVVYIEVARRAGVYISGISFPGHFLVRARTNRHDPEEPRDILIDPFNGGAVLGESDCRELLRSTLGEEAVFDRRMLAPADKPQIITRMLHNLKRLYVSMRSFPQARDIVEMLVALNPAAAIERRDRGLIAYHLGDYPRALRDLESYLTTLSRPAAGDSGDEPDEDSEHKQIWEHVKMLRRRMAGLN